MNVPPSEPHVVKAEGAPPEGAPPASEQPPVAATLPPAPAPASRWSRVAASLIDAAVLLVVAGAYPLVEVAFGRIDAIPDSASAWTVLSATAIALVLQWVFTAARGVTLGYAVTGSVARLADGSPPGLLRGVLVRSVAPLALSVGLAFVLPRGADVPWWAMAVRVFVLLRLVDALFALGKARRTVRDRLAGTRVFVAAGHAARAFTPPRFSGKGFVVAALGLVASALASALAIAALQQVPSLESTDVDVPLVIGGALAPVLLVAFGALASYSARRFLVGELALVALLASVLLFDALAGGLVQVPALQKFELASWIDWTVYAAGLYFGALVFLVVGSALGFMLDRDQRFTGFRALEWLAVLVAPLLFLVGKLIGSRKFEWQVARRHLRLDWRHFVQLAVIATLAPVLVYGVVIWPVRAVWRLAHGRPVPRPLPPTVFMSLLTIVGVMFGVMSLTVVLAVMGGFERDLKDKILGTNAHGVVHRFVGDFTDWEDVQKKIGSVPGVEGVTPFILSEVMITTDTAVTGAVLKGIDVETVGSVTDLKRYIDVDDGSLENLLYPDRIPTKRTIAPPDLAEGERPGEEPAPEGEVLPGIVVGREMSRALNVWIGDRVTVMNPLGELGPSGPIPRSRVYRVAAVFVSGMYEYDSKFAYITLRDAQRFFRMGDSVSGIELRFANVDEARPLMRRILGVLGNFPYRGKDWGEMNKNLFAALRLERVVMFILLSFQVLIACICVIATLVMLVVEKRKEVATLKAMGAREGSIMKLFVIEGLVIGAIGTLYGSAAGFLFCKLIEKYGVGLDPEVYYITRLPVVIEPATFAAVALVAMTLVFVATIYPARRGGSIAPVEGFREE